MPDANGFLHLSDAPSRINIICSSCPRKGSYDRQRQIAELGDIKLPDFLAHVSKDCPQRNHEINGPKCGARYAEDSIVRTLAHPRNIGDIIGETPENVVGPAGLEPATRPL